MIYTHITNTEYSIVLNKSNSHIYFSILDYNKYNVISYNTMCKSFRIVYNKYKIFIINIIGCSVNKYMGYIFRYFILFRIYKYFVYKYKFNFIIQVNNKMLYKLRDIIINKYNEYCK